MTIAFCGHAQFQRTEKIEKALFAILEERVGEREAEMLLGGYGAFDEFAFECCKKYKERHPLVSLIFVTPYLTEEYQRNRLEYQSTRYDSILYPNLEDKPLRFAISYRNRYMMEKADLVIACIDHSWGGAFKTYQYAKKMEKTICNLGSYNDISS